MSVNEDLSRKKMKVFILRKILAENLLKNEVKQNLAQ